MLIIVTYPIADAAYLIFLPVTVTPVPSACPQCPSVAPQGPSFESKAL
jgi:hypothetical protein